MPFGATLLEEGGVRFRLWAPRVEAVTLTLHGGDDDGGDDGADDESGDGADAPRRDLPMHRDPAGWHERIVPSAGPGTRYTFGMADGTDMPDPASRSNPDGVHAPSVVVDPSAYAWQDDDWCGRPWHEAVLYELHVGTFTQAGTYLAAIDRLDDLAALGITALELMPLSSFPGQRGWGYDGVLEFAPQASYGTPDDLKRLVDAAHARDLMVLLDVVYNHFGPEGNYLHGVVPEFFNPAHRTPWGAAINFDGDHHRVVRDFFVHNALYWVEEFRFDGLRLDAVHAIRDDSDTSIVAEIGAALRAFGTRCDPPRHVYLTLENDDNGAHLLERAEAGVPRVAVAQWNDDFHHAAHVLATGETHTYYADYAEAPLRSFGRTLAEGFAWQGEQSAYRDDTLRGAPSAHLTSVAFVAFLQNHDQIGNRPFGDRLATLVEKTVQGPQRLEALQACQLLAPSVPLLFMGEEFAASTPFLYFCDFGPTLAAAVTQGRLEEFKHLALLGDAASHGHIPDANDPATFLACKLDWAERDEPFHARRWQATRDLIAVRTRLLVPRLAHPTLGGNATVDGQLLQVQWVLGDGSVWHLALNLGDDDVVLPVRGETVWAVRADSRVVHANGVRVALESTTPSPAQQALAEATALIERVAEVQDDEIVEPTNAVSSTGTTTPDPEPA